MEEVWKQLPTSSPRLTPHAFLLATANCLLLPHASRLMPAHWRLATAYFFISISHYSGASNCHDWFSFRGFL